MSQRHRRRRYVLESWYPERAGGPSEAGPNRRLPRAKESVQDAIEDYALSRGYGGEAPMPSRRMANQVAYSGARRQTYGGQAQQRISPFPAKRLFEQLKELKYRAPARTLVCQQRTVRKEVLFARRVAGFRRSPGRGGSYRRRPESYYGC